MERITHFRLFKIGVASISILYSFIAYGQGTITVVPQTIKYNVISDYIGEGTKGFFLNALAFYVEENDSLIIKKLLHDFGNPLLQQNTGNLVWQKTISQGWKDKNLVVTITRGPVPEVKKECIVYFTTATTLNGKDLLRPLVGVKKDITIYLNELIAQQIPTK